MWLANIDRRAVAPQAVVGIVRQHGITRDSFRTLDSMTEIRDPDGKSYFVIPGDAGGDDARAATLLTYLLNAGTGYGRARSDFDETPYSAAEVRRIRDRQRANRWSYEAVRFISGAGGCLLATPNAMLMGLGGNMIQYRLSRRGGTTWGDVFLLNAKPAGDPAAWLCEIVESGRLGSAGADLDRLLHHEEIHAQQWARLGAARMSAAYLAEEARVRILGGANRFEREAGLSDGGYR